MFASILGIALTYSCRLAVDERILDELRTIFTIDLRQTAKIKSVEVSHVRSCADRIYNYCNYFPLIFSENKYHVVELVGFWQSYKYFHRYTKLIQMQFSFRKDIKN
jgi:hypothetical protein